MYIACLICHSFIFFSWAERLLLFCKGACGTLAFPIHVICFSKGVKSAHKQSASLITLCSYVAQGVTDQNLCWNLPCNYKVNTCLVVVSFAIVMELNVLVFLLISLGKNIFKQIAIMKLTL